MGGGFPLVLGLAVLTDGAVGVGAEVPGADGGVRAADGGRRGLAEPERVADVVVPVHGLPFVTAAQGESTV